MWAPSHVQIPENDKADAMVYEAVSSATTNSTCKIFTKDLINEVQKRIIKT